MKRCRYRKCQKEILNGRSDKEFCNRSCKRMEQTYRKRSIKKIKKTNEKTKSV